MPNLYEKGASKIKNKKIRSLLELDLANFTVHHATGLTHGGFT